MVLHAPPTALDTVARVARSYPAAAPGLREAQERQKAKDAAEQTRAEREAERFAILKNAPTAGSYTSELAVHHRPFGVNLRQVKCSRCGEWGHQQGDRECPMRHTLTDLDHANKARDDPLQRAAAGAEASGGELRWAPKAAPEARMHGGTRIEVSKQVPCSDSLKVRWTSDIDESFVLEVRGARVMRARDVCAFDVPRRRCAESVCAQAAWLSRGR